MPMILLHNGLVLDPRHGEACGGVGVLAEGAIIREAPERQPRRRTHRLWRAVLMPGLSDAHVCVL